MGWGVFGDGVVGVFSCADGGAGAVALFPGRGCRGDYVRLFLNCTALGTHIYISVFKQLFPSHRDNNLNNKLPPAFGCGYIHDS